MGNEDNYQPWEYLKEIGESERHFNNIQAKYRLLASTWLLASFAGIGFVLRFIDPPDKDLFICLVSSGGSIGVLLIWLVDILGYHRLLAAYFLEGLRIELENQNLPQIRWLMMELGTVGPKVRIFYFVCTLAPVSTGLVVLLPSFILNHNDSQKLRLILALLALLSLALVVGWKTKNPKYAKKYKELSAKREAMQAQIKKSMRPSDDGSVN